MTESRPQAAQASDGSLLCPACGEKNPRRARFCLACGSALGIDGASQHETRRTVTVLFSDLTGSTALGERLDPESFRRVLVRYFAEMGPLLERHGGRVEKFIGDAVMAVFSVPRAREDDALRAVRAAAAMREALVALNEELHRAWGIRLGIRTGLNTGEVVLGAGAAGYDFVLGDAVNGAARLEQAAQAGEIPLGEKTHRLVRDAVDSEPVPPLSMKGKEQPLPAFRLIGVRAGGPARARRLEAPLVGRERDLHRLQEAFERAVRDRACRRVTVLGPAGIGKSPPGERARKARASRRDGPDRPLSAVRRRNHLLADRGRPDRGDGRRRGGHGRASSGEDDRDARRRSGRLPGERARRADPRRCRGHGEPRGALLRRFARCSKRSPVGARSSSSSTTSTGPSRRFSTSSSTSPSGRATPPSSSSASHGPSWSIRAPVGGTRARTDRRSRSKACRREPPTS
jgi:class 3 adenylate cyclase